VYGNVGIGTTNPETQLEVRSTSATGPYFRLSNNQNARIGIELVNNTGTAAGWRINNVSDGGVNRLDVGQLTSETGVSLGQGNTSWAALSDERFKENWGEITLAVNKIKTLRAGTFTWKNSSDKSQHVGVIAQDVLKVQPEAVDTSDPNKYQVRYTEIIPLLIKGIQEQSAVIDELKARLEKAGL